MNWSSETVSVLIVLLPGFLSSAVLDALIVRKDRDLAGRVLEALVFSFLTYAISSALLQRDAQGASFQDTGVGFEGADLLLILGVAFVLPVLLSVSINNDLHMRVLRKIRVTSKTSRDAVWLDVFTDQEAYVIVNFKDGRRLFGWPMYYADSAEDGHLYLHDPAWINEEGQYVELARGIFIVDASIVETIEFLDLDASNAIPAKTDA
ncbi:MAG: DUF6338 family protein [Bacteroidota bacterium]